VKSLDRKKIGNAQKILDWAIQSLDLSIKCMVLNYKDQKYKVQFFTWEKKVIRGVGFNIPEEWIKDTDSIKNDVRDELKRLLVELEQEARREMRELNGSVSKKSETD
jgi:MinD-like ATPase involved in chromosome partitioning or flagellar assembly